MCSIGEDDFGDDGGEHAMIKTEILQRNDEIPNGLCKKCNKEKVVVKLDYKEAECKTCFLTYIRHKFRATLGSSKILPKDANVIVYFDGSPESVVLLDMIYNAQSENTYKRLHCNVKVLFVDETILKDRSDVDCITKIKNLLDIYPNLNSYHVNLASNHNTPTLLSEYKSGDITEDEKQFKNRLENLTTLTSKQDFILQTRKNVIRFAAAALNCEFVFLPDISSDLATTLLNNISLGRGGSTALDVSLVDDRFSEQKLIRPIKDLNGNEINNYIKLNNLNWIQKQNYGDDFDSSSSIQNLTRDFIMNLQENFPSTVSTVFRTGDKITAKINSNKKINGVFNLTNLQIDSQLCKFCHSKLDYTNSPTLLAIEFSRIVSENADQSIGNVENLETKAKNYLHGNTEDSRHLKQLCAGCRNIYHDSSIKTVFT